MKVVFIFGAGASRAAGGPLMSDFLDKADALLRKRMDGVIESKADFEDVFSIMEELRTVHSKSYLNLDNIESLFGAIEMGQIINKLGKRDPESISKLRTSLITLIYKTLEYSIPFPINSSGHINPVQPYENFVQRLLELRKNSSIHDKKDFAFLTFNYDMALDYALYHERFPFDYCLSDGGSSGGTPYLKLHGSINWGVCQECKNIIPFEFKNVTHGHLWDLEVFYYNMGTNLSLQKCHDKPILGPPVLVPPTWNKTGYHKNLANVWQRAAKELEQAEQIIVIGYSLPETDSFFRYLFALGIDGPTRLKSVLVIDPDESGEVRKRFEELIGPGIKHRFRFAKTTFQDSMNSGLIMNEISMV